MELQQIQMDKERARELYLEYKAAPKSEETAAEDTAIARGYKALSEGRAIIDLKEAFASAGVDDEGRPRLAIAGSTALDVVCRTKNDTAAFYWGNAIHRSRYGNIETNRRATRSIRRVACTGVGDYSWGKLLHTPTPNVPPRFRPKRGLRWCYTLWEVDKWESVPYDPFLLRRVGGDLYVVLAQWDLTELERSVLAGTRGIH